MQSRRLARRIALQILFANEFLREPEADVALRVVESLNEELSPFTLSLVQKTTLHEEELNDLIRKHLRNWDYKRVAVLDRVLIRMALCEIAYFSDIPVEVSINEALEIGKDFCTQRSRRFVNGILDSIFKELKGKNLLNKKHTIKLPFKSQSFGKGKTPFTPHPDPKPSKA